jgi:hypothetical protein
VYATQAVARADIVVVRDCDERPTLLPVGFPVILPLRVWKLWHVVFWLCLRGVV